VALNTTILEGHRNVRVTAHLRAGVGLDLPYGLDLAGVLASRQRDIDRAAISERGLGRSAPLPDSLGEEPEDLGLPLSECSTGEDWHWLASCAIPVGGLDEVVPRTFYRVLDSTWLHAAAERPVMYHHPSKGPHRDMMIPAPVLMCAALEWRAVGDPDGIHDMVRGIPALGRRRSTGDGAVLGWDVEDVGDADPAWAHVHGADIIRPCPVECAEDLGVPYRIGHYALRPPSWNPNRLTSLAMTPEPEEDW